MVNQVLSESPLNKRQMGGWTGAQKNFNSKILKSCLFFHSISKWQILVLKLDQCYLKHYHLLKTPHLSQGPPPLYLSRPTYLSAYFFRFSVMGLYPQIRTWWEFIFYHELICFFPIQYFHSALNATPGNSLSHESPGGRLVTWQLQCTWYGEEG